MGGGGGGRFTLFAAKCSAFKQIARFRCDPSALLIVVLAGLGTAHILVRTATYGLEVRGDFMVFLSTTINVLAGEGLQDFTGRPLVGWPPLFVLLLAAFGWVGIEPLAASRWINATAFGLTILASGGWLRSNLRSRWLTLAATATIAASLPLSEFASRLMTEPLLVLLTLLALVQLASFLHRGGQTPLLLGAVFTGLTAVTRWPGVVLIGTGVLLLLVRRTSPLVIRLKDAVVFSTIASLPLAGVMTRNWAVSGTLTGRRGASGQSLSAGLHQIAEVFGEWVAPPNAPDGVAYLLWLAVAAVGLAGAAVVLHGRQPAPKAAPAYFRLGPVFPFAGFALAYLSFMVAVVPFTVRQGIDSRYLLPVYVPLLLVAAFLLDRFLSIKAAGQGRAACGLASLVLLAALAHGGFSVHRNLRITYQAWREGFKSWTLNGSDYESSEALNYIRLHLSDSDSRIYSQHNQLTWFWDRTAPPGKHQYLPGKIHQLIPHIMRRTEGDGAYIVWLQHQKPSYAYDALDLRCLPGVEPVAELSDGVVFRLTTAATEPFDAERHRACKQSYVDQLLAQVGERVVRSDWDVYRNGRKLTYLKQPCASADTQAKFVLHVTPADPGGLSRSRQRYGFDNLGFHFNWRGIRRGDQCIAIAHLPAYAIDRIRVGQWIANENRTLWDAEFSPSR